MNEKNSDGKMGLVVERVYIYIYMYVIDIFNIGVIFESFELFFKFFVMLYIWILIVNLKEY